MTPGQELFCRYAYHPNQLGYCGPSQWDGLDVRAYAKRFLGAWAYQQVIADMMGLDPLDEEVVKTYWTGSAAGDQLDRREFWERLIAIIGPHSGGYWSHLGDPALPREATPSHAFHVLGVYPWTRLLSVGPEALDVLNGCLLRPAQIANGTARTRALRYENAQLRFVDTSEDVSEDVAPGTFVLHWGGAANVVTSDDAQAIWERLERQVELTNRRLAS